MHSRNCGKSVFCRPRWELVAVKWSKAATNAFWALIVIELILQLFVHRQIADGTSDSPAVRFTHYAQNHRRVSHAPEINNSRTHTLNIGIRETVVIKETRQGTGSAKLNYKKRLEKQEAVVIKETVVIKGMRPGAFPAVSLITMFGMRTVHDIMLCLLYFACCILFWHARSLDKTIQTHTDGFWDLWPNTGSNRAQNTAKHEAIC